ncbi:hypothetical protein B566_EDAN015633 [Ephemera danica]|nr:hypothetical protein B566_EDAN015633 [Ephemera danica]
MELEMDDAYHEAAGKMLEEREVFWTSFIDKWKDMSGAEKQPPIELPDSAFANSNSSFRNLRSEHHKKRPRVSDDEEVTFLEHHKKRPRVSDDEEVTFLVRRFFVY